MFESDEWGPGDLGRYAGSIYGSAAISFAKVLSGLLDLYYLPAAGLRLASILGESLGYRLLTVSGEPADFKRVKLSWCQSRQEEIQS